MFTNDTYEHISVDVADGVATVTFGRPEKYNALNTETMLDLQRAFAAFRLDRDIDVVVVEGEGDEAFSAGADIEQYAGPTEDHDPMQRDRQALFYDIYRVAQDTHAPVIAKIDGYCVGGGLIFAMYCDLRIASEGSQFGVPVTDIGQISTGGSTYRAAQLVGEAKAKELVFTAGYVDGQETHRVGPLNDLADVVDDPQTAARNLVVKADDPTRAGYRSRDTRSTSPTSTPRWTAPPPNWGSTPTRCSPRWPTTRPRSTSGATWARSATEASDAHRNLSPASATLPVCPVPRSATTDDSSPVGRDGSTRTSAWATCTNTRTGEP